MEKNTRAVTEAKDTTPVRLPPRNDIGSDHIIADFRARQMRPAYQEMLVSGASEVKVRSTCFSSLS